MAEKRKKKAGAGSSRARERERLLERAAALELPERADVVVLGGGAAGLACAIAAAEAGAEVVVLERDLECGRTILATGNGRCNFANTDLSAEHYNQPDFVSAVMGEGEAALTRIQGFFADCGLAWADEEGRLYPRSRQAASVRNVLLARAERAGVTFACGREVVGAEGPSWRVSFAEAWGGETNVLEASALVFAGGGSAHALAGELGLPLVADEPVLCALAAQGPAPGMLEALDGRRAHCVASLTRGGRVVAREAGEALFRPYGISGIVTFDLSRHARPGDMLELDLAPEVDAWEVDKLVAGRPGDARALDGILDPAVAAELIKLAGGVNFGGLAWRVAPLVKGLPLRITGKADEARAQVTRGGIDVAAVCRDDLAVIGRPGLFACGEALDVDGACGGYNLAWAWLSGLRAGACAASLAIETRERLAAEAAELAAKAEKAGREAGDKKPARKRGRAASDEKNATVEAASPCAGAAPGRGVRGAASPNTPEKSDAPAPTNRTAKKGNA